MLQVLDECPYTVQALFWVGTLSGVGWGVGIILERMKRKLRLRRQVATEPTVKS